MIKSPIIYKFFKGLTGPQFLAVDLSPIFINTGTTNETFQQSGKQDYFRHILKSSASVYESLPYTYNEIIYTSIPTHSQNSLEAAEAPTLKISSHVTSLK